MKNIDEWLGLETTKEALTRKNIFIGFLLRRCDIQQYDTRWNDIQEGDTNRNDIM